MSSTIDEVFGRFKAVWISALKSAKGISGSFPDDSGAEKNNLCFRYSNFLITSS